MRQLTERQKKVLEFITSYFEKHGYSPSIRDIAKAFRITPRGAMMHLVALEKKGYISRSKKARSIKLLNVGEAVRLPVVGMIAAGNAIEAIERVVEMIEVPKQMLKTGFEHYVLKVKGDSMVNEHIVENDYVVIRKQDTAESGDIVSVLVDNSETTLKKIYFKDGKIVLKPANPALKPIELEPSRVKITGKVVGVIRIYE
ncbi:LexA family transcriptional regulator [Thermotoga sp. Ku-13t]|uniref:transcriptional repressor LexA n=1 Tax=Thermotoga sp. Ku-13t TaxID=1755813 RepID=UPI0013EC0D99|nr:transcriptional repressor LexA [Thermotoga sp. Ku-13t]KAF2958908.1 LexA family transcriptional regulator [Thermotoga sp. Ku-13t]